MFSLTSSRRDRLPPTPPSLGVDESEGDKANLRDLCGDPWGPWVHCHIVRDEILNSPPTFIDDQSTSHYPSPTTIFLVHCLFWRDFSHRKPLCLQYGVLPCFNIFKYYSNNVIHSTTFERPSDKTPVLIILNDQQPNFILRFYYRCKEQVS